jgi:sRNA-binding regulator protein Hfq
MPQNQAPKRAASLEALAGARFKREFTEAEKNLLASAPLGKLADCGVPNRDDKDPSNDPGKAAGWDPKRNIAADLVRWLCIDKSASAKVDPMGVWIQGAKITGGLDLSFAVLTFPLQLWDCALTEEATLYQMQGPRLALDGCWTKAIRADASVIRGNVDLRDGFHADGGVWLQTAQIAGQIDCDGGVFINSGGEALNLEGVDVKGSIYLRDGFHADGMVRLLGARVDGSVECGGGTIKNGHGNAISADGAHVTGSVFLRNGFRADGAVRLLGAQIGGELDCSRGTLSNPGGQALAADGVDVKGGVFLGDDFRADGAVRLLRAQIGGDLVCNRGTLSNQGGEAINADRADIRGSVFLSKQFHANGEVRLMGTQIGGDLDCVGGAFHKPGGDALSADGVKVKGVFLRDGFHADGAVRLLGAQIDADLDCGGGIFNHPDGDALNADGVDAKGGVYLRSGFRADGKVNLLDAQVGSLLDCSGGIFNHPGGDALIAARANIKGGAFLNVDSQDRHFQADGVVSLNGAQVGGDLDCSGGVFNNPAGDALDVDRTDIKGHAYLKKGFHVNGRVRVLDARIAGILDCRGATFNNPGDYALVADRAEIKGDVRFDVDPQAGPFHADGSVAMRATEVDGDLVCSGGTMSKPGGDSLAADGARFNGRVFLDDGFTADGRIGLSGTQIGRELILTGGILNTANLDLTNASAGSIQDDWNGTDMRNCWPAAGNLYLDGFVYKQIAVGSSRNPEVRLEWLKLQPEKPFAAQPYLHLAEVLRAAGDDSGAARVLVAMEDRSRAAADHSSRLSAAEDRVGSLILKGTIGYGNRPLLAFPWILGLTGLGWILYRRSYLTGGMVPTEREARKDFEQDGRSPAHYPAFSPLVYSVENSLPLVKLGQADKWQPDPVLKPAHHRNWVASAIRSKAWRRLKWLERSLIFAGLVGPSKHERPSRFSRFGASPRFLRWFLWAQILLGWLLATLFLAGVTGVVRKD